jgi:hypothetical protein
VGRCALFREFILLPPSDRRRPYRAADDSWQDCNLVGLLFSDPRFGSLVIRPFGIGWNSHERKGQVVEIKAG